MRKIDLNSDLGESFGPWSMGADEEMLAIVSSANIACGGHASDPVTMRETVRAAKAHGVAIGAHPGFADKVGFGRRRIPMEMDEITAMVTAQIGALQAIARLEGTEVSYVKAHGALANWAAAERDVANAVVSAVVASMYKPRVLAISGTELETAGRMLGTEVFSEVFADRGYQPNGQLVPRSAPGAMIHDAGEAAERMLAFLETGSMPTVDGDPIPLEAQSICVHGDGPTAVAMARNLRDRLVVANIDLQAFA